MEYVQTMCPAIEAIEESSTPMGCTSAQRVPLGHRGFLKDAVVSFGPTRIALGH